MLHEFFPKEILPPHEDENVTERKWRNLEHLRNGVLDSVNAEIRPTALDFQGLSPDSTENDFLIWIEKELGIKREFILENQNTPESAEKYRLLDYAYQRAKNFLRDVLKYEPRQRYIGPKSLFSKEDIFDLLKNTILARGVSDGLSRSVAYCRLVKTTIATYETLKHNAKLLKNITANFEDALISSPLEGENRHTPLVYYGEHESGSKFQASTDSALSGTLAFRGKDVDKAILRFITRPESNAEIALRDGIASRITIAKDQAVKLLPILYVWLISDMEAGIINIENQGYLSPQQIKELKKALSRALPENGFRLTSNTGSNSSSMGKFETLKVTGILKSLKNGEKPISELVSAHARQFEIQLVSPDNQNEEGEMHHAIYDIVKLVTARTRMDGGCSEPAFNEFINNAIKEINEEVSNGDSRKQTISVEYIKHCLLETPGAPIIKYKKRNGKFIYIAHSVYLRWDKFGWVDEALMRKIEKARKY